MTKHSHVIAVMFALCLSLCGHADAETGVLQRATFEDQDLSSWSIIPGKGDAEITTYQGNSSLRLRRDAAAVRPFDTGEATAVAVSAKLAAFDLEGEDACRVEASVDLKSWYPVGAVTDGEDDGVTLTSVSETLTFSEAPGKIYVGIRADANAANDSCWFDDITVRPARDMESLSGSLPSAVLWSDDDIVTEPVSATAFSLPPEVTAPEKDFSGRLSLAASPMDHFELLKDDFAYAPTAEQLTALPPLTVDLVQQGGGIIPVQRGPQAGAHPDWEWVVEPGRIWLEGDETVFVLPFSLQERNANCLHNGLMTFRTRGGATSRAYLQIGSETCAYLQFGMWATVDAQYVPMEIAEADRVRLNYARELATRLPVRPIGELPGSDQFAHPSEVPGDTLTTFGLYHDGIHYSGGCPTRFGPHPYCEVVDLPSYSFAKSIVAGFGAMRLEKLYPGAMEEKIADHVPACAASDWHDVTFADALNMATGLYNSAEYEVDENSAAMRDFFLADSHADKLDIICHLFERQSESGQVFVYQTAATYILGTAMNHYLRQQAENPQADYFIDLVAPVWSALGVSQTALNTRRTYDEVKQPFSGWGVTLLPNDLLLITRFLQEGGVLNEEQLLDEKMLTAALQKNPQDRGLEAVIPSQRYKYGFWAWNAGPHLGCAEDVWIPAMSGYGGLSAALLPNGMVYYYFSDGGAFAWARAAAAANDIEPFCEVAE